MACTGRLLLKHQRFGEIWAETSVLKVQFSEVTRLVCSLRRCLWVCVCVWPTLGFRDHAPFVVENETFSSLVHLTWG